MSEGHVRVVQKISIRNCPRCGQDHEELEAKEFSEPVVLTRFPFIKFYVTKWLMCPVMEEPVLYGG